MSSPSTYLPTTGSAIPTFASLAEPPKRWTSFITSFGLQTALVIAGVTLTITAAPELIRTYNHIELASPALLKPEVPQPAKTVAPPRVKILVPQVAVQKQIAVPAPAVQVIQKPILVEAARKLPTAPAPKFETVSAPPAPKVLRAVMTAAFGSSAEPTLKNTPVHAVQTGGFGDPNGLPANDNARSGKLTAAKLGSFDLPPGGGQGNGSGGTTGLRGTVASTGFGNGVAIQPGNERGNSQARVQTTAFNAAPTAAEAPKKKVVVETPVTPASITSKPIPVYTEEARKLHVEGEVLVQVTFSASGQVRVLHVVRGLGHGLDDAAVRAAEGIRFTPAQRDGHAVDSNATLHIVFQLS